MSDCPIRPIELRRMTSSTLILQYIKQYCVVNIIKDLLKINKFTHGNCLSFYPRFCLIEQYIRSLFIACEFWAGMTSIFNAGKNMSPLFGARLMSMGLNVPIKINFSRTCMDKLYIFLHENAAEFLFFHGPQDVNHHSDAIISAVVSQITGVSIVSSKRLFRVRSQKTSKLRVTCLCEGNSPVTGEFPAKRASNAENVSIRWHHHGCSELCLLRGLFWQGEDHNASKKYLDSNKMSRNLNRTVCKLHRNIRWRIVMQSATLR